jgi:hypothetical protein
MQLQLLRRLRKARRMRSALGVSAGKRLPDAGHDCSGLREAIRQVDVYIDSSEDPFAPSGGPFTGDARAALESCRETLLAAEPARCDACESWRDPDELSPRRTPSGLLASWSMTCGSDDLVGIARGCGMTVVFYAGFSGHMYYVFDETDAPIGYYGLDLSAEPGCYVTTSRIGTQIACFDGIGDWCDTSVRQLFNLENQVFCPTLETCEVCGSGNWPASEDVP